MTRMICHRGARLEAPENTLAGARRALQLGGAWIELDIRQSRDGVHYVLHDATVDRTTDGIGPIAEMLGRDLDRLDAGGRYAPAFAGEPLPRLDAFLMALADKAEGVCLDVKAGDPEALAALVAGLDLAGRCILTSADADLRAALRRSVPAMAQMVSWAVAGNVDAALDLHRARVVAFGAEDLDASAVWACKAAGLQTLLGATRLDRGLFRKACELGVDHVLVDHISEFAEIRARMGPRSEMPSA